MSCARPDHELGTMASISHWKIRFQTLTDRQVTDSMMMKRSSFQFSLLWCGEFGSSSQLAMSKDHYSYYINGYDLFV